MKLNVRNGFDQEEKQMKRKFLSLIIVLAMLLSIFPMTAIAAPGAADDYFIDIQLSKDTSFEYNGKPTMEVSFWMKSGTADINAISWAVLLIDLTRFDILDCDGEEFNDAMVEGQNKAYDDLIAHYLYKLNKHNKFVDQINTRKEGNKGIFTILPDWRGLDNAPIALAESTKVMAVRLGLKDGAEWDNLPAGCIRFATVEEAGAAGQSSVACVNTGGPSYMWGIPGGGADTLTNAPTFTPVGFTFAKAALAGAVAITGTPKINEPLNVDVTGITSDTPGTLSYKWYYKGTTAEIGTGATYTPNKAADVGKTIAVDVSAANYNGVLTAETAAAVEKADGPAAPVGLAEVSKTHNTITVTANPAWEYSRDNGATWQDSNTFTGLAANTVYDKIVARVKETGTHKASGVSAAISVTTSKAPAGEPVAPVIASKTDTNVNVTAVAGQKYMIKPAGDAAPVAGDPGWGDVVNFGGLMANTAYKVYTYIPENGTLASAVVFTEVTTDKTSIVGKVTVTDLTKTYNGAVQEPTFTGLTRDTDYTVAYAAVTGTLSGGKPLGAGTYTVTVSGIGTYGGSFNENFTINKKAIAVADFTELGTANKTYTGSAITQTITPNGVVLNTDYTVEYSDNTYVGTAKYTITGKGNYNGTITKTFSITAAAQTLTKVKDLSVVKGGTLNAAQLAAAVGGAKGELTFTVTGGTAGNIAGNVFTAGANTGDVTVKATAAAKDEGGDANPEYTADATGITFTVSVVDKALKDLTVTQANGVVGQVLADPGYTEPGGTIATSITYTGTLRDGVTLYADPNVKPQRAGTYKVTVKCETDTEIYEGFANFTIAPKSIAGATVTLGPALTYNGGDQTQTVTKVELDGKDITADCDITNNKQTNAGNYTLTVKAKAGGDYTGEVTKAFIINRKPVTPTITVTGGPYVYNNGIAINPTYTVKVDGALLDAAEYTAVISDNINAGNGKITVTDKAGGNYAITEKVETFAINKAAAPGLAPFNIQQRFNITEPRTQANVGAGMLADAGALTYSKGAEAKTGAVTISAWNVDAEGKVSYTLANGAVGDTVKLTVKINSDNYKEASVDVNIELIAKDVEALAVTQADWVYGNATPPAPVFTEPAGTIGAPVISYKGIDGTVYGPDPAKPVNVGKYEVTVKCETDTTIYTGTAAFSISKKPLAAEMIKFDAESFEYSGTAKKPVVTIKDGADNITGSCDITNDPKTDVGTYTVTVKAKDNSNYKGEVSKTYTITKKTIAPTITVTGGPYVYTGAAIIPTFKVMDGADEIANAEYTAAFSNNTNAGNGKITITANAGGNYIFDPATAEEIFVINKAGAYGLADIPVNVKAGDTTEKTLQLGRGGMPAGAGALTYNPGVATVKPEIVSAFNIDATGKLSFTLNNTAAVGDTVHLNFSIGSDNYANSPAKVVVTVSDKDAQAELKYSGATSVTFGQSLTLGYTGGSGDGELTYVSGDNAIAIIAGNKLTPVKAGNVTVTVKKAGSGTFAEAQSVPVTITINKAKPTGAPAYTAITAAGKTLADAALTAGTINPAGGTIAWDLDAATVVTPNTAYNWTYTPALADQVNYENLTGSITPYYVYIAPPAPPAPPTIPANDGAVSVDYSESKGVVSLSMPDKKVEEIIAKAKDGKVDIDVSGIKNATAAEMPKEALAKLAAADLEMTIKLPAGSITLDQEAVNSIDDQLQGEKVSIELLPVKPSALSDAQKESVKTGDIVVDINIRSGEKKISEFNGSLKIQMPYSGPQPVAVWYLNDAGELEELEYTFENGVVTFYLNHLSLYMLGQNVGRVVKWNNPFIDVKQSDWFYNSIKFAHQNKLMGGIGKNLFNPRGYTTRGMVATIMHNLEGNPEPKASNPFKDVAANKYYSKAVAWAAENKIVGGYGNGKFGPDDYITREQLAMIFMNYAKYKGYDISARVELKGFGDAATVSGWALDAMSWAKAKAIINGDGANLKPTAKAERCQAAAIFQNFIENVRDK